MSKRIEVEKKFFCEHDGMLFDILEENNFTLSAKESERDEYFTDIQSNFVKNRTCLRLRIKNNKFAELTFKGKSCELNNLYIKEESNVEIKIEEYDDMVKMLHSLGYLSYTIVDKKRAAYSMQDSNLIFNVMVDEISEVGTFIEFEILANKNDYDINELEEILNSFIGKFSKIKLSEADIPYRDFVANKLYDNIKPKNDIEALLLDLDGTLINSEHIFEQSFSDVIKQLFDYKLDADEYKENELDRNNNLINHLKEKGVVSKGLSEKSIMNQVYSRYKDGFIDLLSKDDTIINFELIKQLKSKGIKLALVTTSKRVFVDTLIKTLDINDLFDLVICREDVSMLKPDKEAYVKALRELGVKSTNAIAVEDSLRGISAAEKANIKAIHIAEKSNKNNVNFDKFSRLGLIILNQL